MTNHSSRFQRQGFMILMICSAIMLGIGIHMCVVNSSSTSIITSHFRNPIEQTITWHTPIAGSLILLILAIFIELDRPTIPKMNVNGKVYYGSEKRLQEKKIPAIGDTILIEYDALSPKNNRVISSYNYD